MKKLLLSCLLGLGIGASAQTVVFEDSFETYTDFAIANVGSWTLRDVDLKPTYGIEGIQYANSGVAKSFQVFNSTTTEPATNGSFAAKTGLKMMTCFASAAAPWNNDWLISPQIQMVATGTSKLSFWAKSAATAYGDEKFKVYVSTTGTATADFVAISPVVTTPADVTWYEYTYDLSAYTGKIYIAIQCVSVDQFALSIDDFKVTNTAPAVLAPNCPTLTAPSNGNTTVGVIPSVTLSWAAATTGGAASSYDVYLGSSPNPTTITKANVTSTTTTVTGLLPATTYYWRVVAKNTIGDSTGCSDFSFTTKASNPPGCVATMSPANGATGVAFGVTPLSWTAPTTGGAPTGYDIYWGISPTSLSLLGNTPNLAVNITNTTPSTTYYWQIVPKNADGSTTGCPIYSLVTTANIFAPYCSGSLFYGSGVEPITSVKLNDMINVSSVSATVAHENFISKVAKVEKGKTYPITLEALTGGDFTNRFIVFIDWNQDGDFADAGETYFGTGTGVVLVNSTGVDGKTAIGDIVVPANALLGNTRMRIKKNFGAAASLSPCYSSGAAANATSGTAGFGQAEDYTINVIDPVMAVNDISKSKASVYPNPFKDVLNISDVKNANSVIVTDISGRTVKTLAPAAELNLSDLKKGVYMVTIKLNDGTNQTTKVIKD